jgi:hypothetical protein
VGRILEVSGLLSRTHIMRACPDQRSEALAVAQEEVLRESKEKTRRAEET